MKPTEPTEKDGQTKRNLHKRTKEDSLLEVAEEDKLKLCPDLRPDIELKVQAAVDMVVHRSKVVVEERDLLNHQ